MQTPFPPIYLAGPTASGKTAVALELARQLGPTEIINADAFQIYRGLEIISAAPTAEERSQVPHHLFGVHRVTDSCDASQFAARALAMIREVSERAVPLVVGGSGLYLKAITHGLAPTPKSNPELRKQLDQESLEGLVARYEQLDPEGAARTNLKNRRYVTRNLEICLLSGGPASTLKSEWQNNQPNLCAFFLCRDREEVYERINLRTEVMFQSGVLDEVKALTELSQTAEKAIGIREIQELIAGTIDKASCMAAIQQATRRYAKRQESWFKRESAFTMIDVSREDSASRIAGKILPHIKTFDASA
ncbi:MAG: tRNA (adenosine(37)-N6)-dimethylallyltransferase MiaA [Verrucomicrobiota bacterium]